MRLVAWWSLAGMSGCFLAAAIGRPAQGESRGTPSVVASPTSGGLGTVITLSVTPQTPGFEIQSGTTARWDGVYDPPMGANTAPFGVDYTGSNIVIVDSWTARVLIGGGKITNAPNVEAVMGGGSLVGTFTLTTPPECQGDANFDHTVNFADITTVLKNFGANYGSGNTGPGDADRNGMVNFADITSVLEHFGTTCTNTILQGNASITLNAGADEWRGIIYPDGYGGMMPPEVGLVRNTILIHRNSLYATPPAPPASQLWLATSAHNAVRVRVSENNDSSALSPGTIKVDLIALNSSGQIVDREPGLTLTKLSNDGDPANIIYQSDPATPIIILDQTVDQASYPQFILLIGTTTGKVSIVPSTQ